MKKENYENVNEIKLDRNYLANIDSVIYFKNLTSLSARCNFLEIVSLSFKSLIYLDLSENKLT